jgi:colicin import membrane protein
MKAALEAWGSKQNLFQRGFAKETEDPATVAAAMAHPGVVLRRAVGTGGKFSENAALPKTVLPTPQKGAPKAKEKPAKKALSAKKPEVDANLQKAAVNEFEKERARREQQRAEEESQRRKAEIAEERARRRRQTAVEKAEAILEKARQHHEEALKKLEVKKSRIDEQLHAERVRRTDEKEKLEAQIRTAGQ